MLLLDWTHTWCFAVLQGFRVSAEQQISAAYLATGSDDLDRIDLEMLREAALTLFNQYLSDKVRAHAYSLLLPVLARYGSRSYLAAYLATGSDDLDHIDLEMLCEAAVMLFSHCLSDKVRREPSHTYS